MLALGVGASGLWWLHDTFAGRDAEITSRAAATEIQAAAHSFRALHADGCPTLSALHEEHFLSQSAREDDAWGNRFRVSCEQDQLAVSSAGPDGKPNNADDIRVPR